MNWLNCNCVVMHSNLVEHEFNFLFAKILFGMNMKGRNPSRLESSCKGLETFLNGH